MDSLVEYVVWVGGKGRNVRLLQVKREDTALIEVDGKAVEVTFPKGLGFNEEALVNANGENHRVRLNRNDRPATFNVEVDGKKFVLRVEAKPRRLNSITRADAISHSYTPRREGTVAHEKGAVTALMPGKVVLLRVNLGDEVEAGDPLCILEAMKMENEIVAPRDGRITQVRVEEGSFVDKGDVLVVIERC